MISSVVVLVLVVILFALVYMRSTSQYSLQPPDKGNLIVYGSPTCPWCVKQLEYLTYQGIPYSFVDCREGQCPDFVNGYPTLVLNNKVFSGYTELGPELSDPSPSRI
jgi:protein-disulfide isomerase